MNIVSSKLNEALAGSLQNKMAAELLLISAKSGFWKAVGVGFIGFGVGAAVSLSLYGYSSVIRREKTVSVLTAAISKSLSEVHLRGTASGVVKFVPREISLAPGQTVALDPASRLYLDPNAKVTADGEVKIELPTISTPQPVVRPKGVVPTITNFTIFKSVPFDKGAVLTGWKFLTSAQRTPTIQYCYYDEESSNPDVDFQIEVGNDEKMLAPKTLPKSFDLVAAFSKCVWFKRDGQ